MNPPDWDVLIPELKNWNNGSGIDPESWVGCTGNFQLACGYSLLFWPQFVEHDGMVLRADFSPEALKGFMQQHQGEKTSVEAVMNHWHLDGLHYLGCPDATHERLIYLGHILKEVHEYKLRCEFPSRVFVVEFDGSRKEKISDYQVTFYQARRLG